jgi:hypothetical protein
VVFITSSTRDLLSVIEIDGRSIPHNGPIMPALRTAFRSYIAEYVRTHGQVGAGVR